MDVDQFWKNIRRPEVFSQYFPDAESTIPDTSSHHSGSMQNTRSRTSSMSSVEKAGKNDHSQLLHTEHCNNYSPFNEICAI